MPLTLPFYPRSLKWKKSIRKYINTPSLFWSAHNGANQCTRLPELSATIALIWWFVHLFMLMKCTQDANNV